MRRPLLAALAVALLAGACASGSDDAREEGARSRGERFAEVIVEEGTIMADTGRFRVVVATDPLRVSATRDGDPVVEQAPDDGGLYLVRDGVVVDAETAAPVRTSVEGLRFDVTFADGSAGSLGIDPVGEGSVHLTVLPTERAGVTHWGERLALAVGEQIRGLTERVAGPPDPGTLDLRGTQVVVEPAAVPPSAPFHQSSAGYAVHVDGGTAAAYDVGDVRADVLDLRVAMPAEVDEPLGYLLLVASTPPELLAEHHAAMPDWVDERWPGGAVPSDEEQLRAALVAVQRAAYLGVVDRPRAEWQLEPAPPEVRQRAEQLAAVTPGPLSSLLAGDERTVALHEALQPYVDELVAEGHQDGVPPVRPLAFRYGDQRESLDRWDQYLLGDDLLVAPVTEVGVRERSVWFPPGRWVSFWDHDEVVEGPFEVVVDAPLETIPLYVREGSDLLDLVVP
jgi:hypothetical protein